MQKNAYSFVRVHMTVARDNLHVRIATLHAAAAIVGLTRCKHENGDLAVLQLSLRRIHEVQKFQRQWVIAMDAQACSSSYQRADIIPSQGRFLFRDL